VIVCCEQVAVYPYVENSLDKLLSIHFCKRIEQPNDSCVDWQFISFVLSSELDEIVVSRPSFALDILLANILFELCCVSFCSFLINMTQVCKHA
jgi:hypothetical protein